MGRHVRYRASDLVAYVESNIVEPARGKFVGDGVTAEEARGDVVFNHLKQQSADVEFRSKRLWVADPCCLIVELKVLFEKLAVSAHLDALFRETSEISTVLADAEGIQFWVDERWERQALFHQTSAVLLLVCGHHQAFPS